MLTTFRPTLLSRVPSLVGIRLLKLRNGVRLALLPLRALTHLLSANLLPIVALTALPIVMLTPPSMEARNMLPHRGVDLQLLSLI